MRVVKCDRNICKCGDVKCSQKDNVYRDGYVSIESQFKQFQRAGINRIEWLKKAYPQETVLKHEQNLFDDKSKEALYRAEQYARGDELNILDGQIEAQERLQIVKNEYEKAKKDYETSYKEYESLKKEYENKQEKQE